MSSTTSSSLSSSNKLKEEGNKLFMKRNYKEAIEMYTKAIEKANISTYYINRGLCYFSISGRIDSFIEWQFFTFLLLGGNLIITLFIFSYK